MKKFIYAFLFAIMVFFTGCYTVPVTEDEKVIYYHDSYFIDHRTYPHHDYDFFPYPGYYIHSLRHQHQNEIRHERKQEPRKVGTPHIPPPQHR